MEEQKESTIPEVAPSDSTAATSQTQPTKHFPKLLIITSSVLLLCIIGIGGYLYLNYDREVSKNAVKNPTSLIQKTTPTPIPNRNISFGKIAYVKDSKLYVSLPSKTIFITDYPSHSQYFDPPGYKWSKNGRYLGWIEHEVEEFTTDSGSSYTEEYGKKLFIYDFKDNIKKELVSIHLPSSEDKYNHSIKGFDFSPDENQILYTQNGIWTISIDGSGQKKLFSDNKGDLNDQTDDRSYVAIDWSNQNNSVLITESTWECIAKYVLDLNKNILSKLQTNGCRFGIWSPDSKYIYESQSDGRDIGGVWRMDVFDSKYIELIDKNDFRKFYDKSFDPKSGIINVGSVSFSERNSIYTSIGFTGFDLDSNTSYGTGDNLYEITNDKSITQITHFKTTDKIQKISYNSSTNKIEYTKLLNVRNNNNPDNIYDLYIMDLDSKNQMKILENIESHTWIR